MGITACLALLAGFAPLQGAADTAPDFGREVRPLLARKCFACHGNDEETQEAGLRLDIASDAHADRGGYAAIVPGDLEESEVWARITDDIDPMPPEHAGAMLDADELDLVRRWIESGAEYAEHWAFVPPREVRTPERTATEASMIDAFVRDRLLTEGLDLSGPANDYTLLRRLSLDLTGLAPTQEQARAFAASTHPNKVSLAIERLLASPAYAERWASVWLDLARYADSSGHGSDPLRTIWRYRDWVIEAFDRNQPFDEFTVHQLAGDLLLDATTETRLATAFHRNTMTNTEGGTDDEEFRVLAVKDRVNTTMQVWMGLTAGCAECHSHKYDPISQAEYYSLFDIFNQTADTDKNNDRPRLETPTPEQAAMVARLDDEISALNARLAEPFDLDGRAEREDALRVAAATDAWSFAHHGAASSTLDEVQTLDDGTVVVGGLGDEALHTVLLAKQANAPTALRIEALSDPSLPRGGPGRNAASGNFVLTSLEVSAIPENPRAVTAQRVRIELPGDERILSLAEVQLDALSAGVELGAQGTGAGSRPAFASARQSSTAYGGPAALAIDGKTSGLFSDQSVTHTATESNPWWEGTLAAPAELRSVRVWMRTDGGLARRAHGFRVVFLDADGAEVWRSPLTPAPAESMVVGPFAPASLLLRATGATHEQKGFDAARAVDGIHTKSDGWAVGGAEGSDHAAIFALPELDGPVLLSVGLRQEWGTDHVFPRFRVGVTSSEVTPISLPAESLRALQVDASDRSPEQSAAVDELLRAHDPRVAATRAELGERKREREALGVVTTPVMEELTPDKRRASHVLVRGNFMQPGEEVHAAVPAAFPPLPDGVEPDRLALAHWLVSDANPLTARVTVNRVWARLFGRGLVRTEGDFGSQGETPTHPELLDGLAVAFRESGWDHKELLRTIVSSKAYQQSSRVTAASMEHDPDASLLSRYPRQRLEAEAIRDVALAASELLSTKRFGPSVYPPQPPGLWKAAFNGQRDWKTSEGEDRYRRGVYVFLRRTIPYPMLATFDAPSRETCTIQRIPTNTPLQAFVTLNDPVFVEAAQSLATSVLDDAEDAEAAIDELLWRTLVRPPLAAEVDVLHALLADAHAAFTGDAASARELAPMGSDHPARDAAWTIVASTALNLDGFLTKE